MDDAGIVIAFWVLAVITVGSALLVTVARNLIHALCFLVVSFMGVAGLYVTLSADFLAVAQILIYAGAISILLVFAIVLTPGDERNNADGFLRVPAALLGVVVAAMLIFAAIDTDWNISSRDGFATTASDIGDALLNQYVLPFEIASILLLVAIIGAIVIVRPEGPFEEGDD